MKIKMMKETRCGNTNQSTPTRPRKMAPVVVVEPPPLLAIGGNRHPAAADWSPDGATLAFGAGRCVALWNPDVALLLLCSATMPRADLQTGRLAAWRFDHAQGAH